MIAPDLLVVMGGPMGVYDTADYPWIAPEIDGIAARIAVGRRTLGVCLGSQMIAAALGARVYPGHGPEVGFAPLANLDMESPLAHLAGVAMLHWHGDTFDLPAGRGGWPPPRATPTRRSRSAIMCWRCSSMARWAKIRDSRHGWTRAGR